MSGQLQNGEQQFIDANGKPLDGGTVDFYIPNTTTRKNTWQDQALTILNTNPVVLDAAGRAVIWGTGSYRQILKDKHGNLVWDKVVSDPITSLSATNGASLVGADDGTGGSIFTTVAGFISSLATSIGSSFVGFIQNGTGAIARTTQDKLREHVSIDDFLSTPGIITQAEYDKAAAQALAKQGVLEMLGAYSFNSLNIAKANLIVECGPKTILTHTGTGKALQIDAGLVGSGMFAFELRGNPLVIGNSNTTDGIFIRAMHHSSIKARAINCVTGFRINFGVCTKYYLTSSVNENSFSITPTAGLITDQRGAGEAVQDCEFYVIMEGINGWGVELNNTNGCEFRGTSEANVGGIVQLGTCARNSFVGMDMESNSLTDLYDYSENATYLDCLSLSLGSGNNAELISARGAKFIGGYWRTVNLQTTSADTIFISVATSDNASLGFKGAGTYKTINSVKQNVLGSTTVRIPDNLGESGTWTPSFAASGGGTQGTITFAVGTYFTIGKLCYVQGLLSIAKGSLTGAVSITGLPFVSRNTTNDYQYIQMSEWDNLALGTGENSLAMRIGPASKVGTLIQSGTSVPAITVDVSAFPDPMGIRFSGVYEIN